MKAIVATSIATCGGIALLLGGCDRWSAAQDRDPLLEINTLLVANACSNCHASDYARVGPSMLDVSAARGPDSPEARKALAGKLLNGTKGSFGLAIMPPQKQLSEQKADELARVILSLKKPS